MPYKDAAKQRQYQAKWRQRRRDEWLREHGPCVNCGSSEHLEVDHIVGADKVDHRLWSWTQARREAELAKCQVLCRRCHLAKSCATGVWGRPEHGTASMYDRGKCRCEPCRAAKMVAKRLYWQRRREREAAAASTLAVASAG